MNTWEGSVIWFNNTEKQRKPNLQREKSRETETKTEGEKERRQRRTDKEIFPRSDGVTEKTMYMVHNILYLTSSHSRKAWNIKSLDLKLLLLEYIIYIILINNPSPASSLKSSLNCTTWVT